MANRSYIYSTNLVPSTDLKKEDYNLVGLSEWNYEIPIIYKLLLTGNPRACKSLIWNDESEDIALVGEYAEGLACLKQFLEKIDLPDAQPLINEALEFLSRPENQRQYFLLECGEIFDLLEEPILEQNINLLEEIKSINSMIDSIIEEVVGTVMVDKFLRQNQISMTESDPMHIFYMLGLGNWSNALYFDPS